MFEEKKLKKKNLPVFILFIIAMIIIPALLISGCSKTGNSSAASPSSSVGSNSTVAPAASASASAPVADQTVKIGIVCWFGWPPGLDLVHTLQVMSEVDNAKGGIDIGGQKYKIELVIYDSNNTQATEVSAVNRLIFEDKVKFIISDGMFIGSWLQLADDNKVVSLAGSARQLNMDPMWKYACCPLGTNIGYPIAVSWLCEKYPDLVKNIVIAVPDAANGHAMETTVGIPAKAMGANMTFMYYPSNQTDLSSLGTKVAQANPGIYSTLGSGDTGDGLAMTAAYQAGYRGLYYHFGAASADSMLKVMSKESVEGLVIPATPTEFTPPLTDAAKAYIEAYTAKFGKWDDPTMSGIAYYSCLIAAFEKAGSIDSDKVCSVIQSGLEFSSPAYDYKMIARPDKGNTRTVDAASTKYFKVIKDGKPVLLDTISVNKVVEMWDKVVAAMAAMPQTATTTAAK